MTHRTRRRFLPFILWTFALASALTGCASNIPPRDAPVFSAAPAAPPGMATLYVFRPFLTDTASGVWPVTFFDDVKVADVKVTSYTYIYIRPGTYKIRTERSEGLSGLGNVPGDFIIPGTGDYYLAFISAGRSSVVQVGTNAMTIAGPSAHSWRMLTKSEAMRFLPQMRYMPPERQSFPGV